MNINTSKSSPGKLIRQLSKRIKGVRRTSYAFVKGKLWLDKAVAYGVYYSVYRGHLHPKSGPRGGKVQIAAKVAPESAKWREILDESKRLADAKHENLLELIGVFSSPQVTIIVTPFMPLGSLHQYVTQNKHKLERRQLFEWCGQMAAGMAHLEKCNIVHRNLALRNVLLRDNLAPTGTSCQVLISDYGLAQFLNLDPRQPRRYGLSVPWFAPECLGREFTHQSDVWAYGVTVWELLSYGECPLRGLVQDQTLEPSNFLQMVLYGARLLRSPSISRQVYEVIHACWQAEPEDRPNFKQLMDQFALFVSDPSSSQDEWLTGDDDDDQTDSPLNDSGYIDDAAGPRSPPSELVVTSTPEVMEEGAEEQEDGDSEINQCPDCRKAHQESQRSAATQWAKLRKRVEAPARFLSLARLGSSLAKRAG